MTLILTLNAPNAICMSVDYRVLNRKDGSILDPYAVKSLVIQTSGDPGGPIALIGYAGLAELWGRMPMGRWLRETLRGECQSLFDLMDHLLNQLNRKIASFKQVLVINVLMVSDSGNERYFGAFTNTKDRVTAEPKFSYGVTRLDKPWLFGNGSACDAVATPHYVDMLKAHVADPDHSAADHMGLLAKINRSVAEADPNGSVSPYCFVTCLSSDTEWKLSQQVFHEPGETPPPFSMPWIFCGIDLSYQAERMVRSMQNGGIFDGTPPTMDEGQLRRHVQRRP
jgi:hypothetical protein